MSTDSYEHFNLSYFSKSRKVVFLTKKYFYDMGVLA